jgi:hypothetical protein
MIYLKISFEQSGGIAGQSRKVTIDTNSLPPSEVQEIESIVDSSKFYELPSSILQPTSAAADYFKYKITLEPDNGNNKHTVETTDITMPSGLSPFIAYLRRKAKEQNRLSK